MESARTNLFTRNDTLLGICEGIGEDFGFNANYLRVLLAVGLLWNPFAMVGIYLGLGVLVLATRLLVPSRRKPAAVAAAEPQAIGHENDDSALELAQAA